MSAGLYPAIHSGIIPDFEFGSVLACPSGYLVSWNYRVDTGDAVHAIFVPGGVQVTVADACIQGFNRHVVISDRMTGKFVRMDATFRRLDSNAF